MALPDAIQGGLRPSPLLTWYRQGGSTPEDLSGATVSGVIYSMASGASRAIAGTLTVTDDTSGIFRWDYAAGDVAEAGSYLVQFTAAFGSGQTPAKTFETEWMVAEAL